MNDLTPFQTAAAAVALKKLLEGPNFYISDVTKLADVLGRRQYLEGQDWKVMETLHCLKYSDMGPVLASEVRAKVLEMLGASAEVMSAPKPPQQSPTEVTAVTPISWLRKHIG